MSRRQGNARELTDNERGILETILTSADVRGAVDLLAQVKRTRVIGGLPTLLDLRVDQAAVPVDIPDGPIPARAIVESDGGKLIGEILIWVAKGFLDGLEFAWVSDEAPAEFPPPSSIRVLTR